MAKVEETIHNTEVEVADECSPIDDGAFDSPCEIQVDQSMDVNQQTPIGLSISIEEGMEFESLEKVIEIYALFARHRGFGFRRRSSKHNYCMFVCINEGKNRASQVERSREPNSNKIVRRRTSTVRTGCQASLHVLKHKWKNVWVVTKFCNQHNHRLVTPRSVPLIRCHRELPEIARCLTEKILDAGVPTGKVVDVVNEEGPYFDKRDCWNHVKKLRLQNLDVGDAQHVYNYCRVKKEEDSEFFYAIQCDDEARMVNFFWVDGRSRRYYSVFGDTVTFDTTYKTNKYSMPFAPFTGINHHMRSMLFGCALLQDESESTFIWLFETWLEAMSGKLPISIVTDQDHAIGNAIAKVFPNTVHRLCIWHIMRKFPEKLASVYHKSSTFKKAIKRCIRSSFTIEEFERDWAQLMLEYKLQDNEWLQGLFEIRSKWVPIFSRGTFFGGMNTTQRSESMNSFFDHFVNSRTNLCEFMYKFDEANHSMYEHEKKEDYDTRHKKRVLHLQSPLEEHAADVYTIRVFGKICDELEKVNKFKKEKLDKEGHISTYRVTFIDNPMDYAIVHFDSVTTSVECSCQLWNSMGFLCRHVFAIFQKKDVHKIPEDYILHRWTKEANVGIDMVALQNKRRTGDLLITYSLQKKFGPLLEIAKESQPAFDYIMEGLDKLHRAAIELYIPKVTDNIEIDLTSSCTGIGLEDNITVPYIQDPNVSQTKGRKKDSERQTSRGRYKSSLEIALNKARVCKRCGQRGHNVRTCKNLAL